MTGSKIGPPFGKKPQDPYSSIMVVKLWACMHLYLIRHAQSANNDLYARTGGSDGRHADPPLTELGHRQANLLAQVLAVETVMPGAAVPPILAEFAARHNRRGFGLTHLYSSLMTRAIQTGSYVAGATGLPLVAWPEVHERGGLHLINEASGEDLGVPGPNRAWFATEFPHLVLPDDLGQDGWWNRPPEPISETVPRARNVWSQLLERHGGTDDHVAIITHAGFFQSLMTALLTADDKLSSISLGLEELWVGMSNVSISRFEVNEDSFVVRYLNRVDFLPDDLVTG